MPHEPIPPDPGLNALESALGSLTPARSRLDRDRTMFRAGQAAATATKPPTAARSRWAKLAAASFAAIALGEAVLLARRPEPEVIEKIIVTRESAPAINSPDGFAEAPAPIAPALPPVEEPFRSGRTPRERLTWQVLRYGLDGLPASPSAAWNGRMPAPIPPRPTLEEEFRRLLDTGDPS